MSHRHNSEYGQSWSIAAALLDQPKDLEGLVKHYQMMTKRYGIYTELLPGQKGIYHHKNLEGFLHTNLKQLVKMEWILFENGIYSLTKKGRLEAERMLEEIQKGGEFIRRMCEPRKVARVTLLIHGILALVKLPAALLSGSIGLLNDALDTLLDSISSLLVHWGITREKEHLVSLILLLFMTITGLYSLYEAVKGLRFNRIPEPDFLAFTAVILSALLCFLMWFYQKFSGIKHRSLPLLTQAMDSRNHVIVAAGVTIGLIASLFRIPYLDAAVGLIVSVLILKGALELLIDIIKSAGEGDLDLSPYGFTQFERHKRNQLKIWLLFRITAG